MELAELKAGTRLVLGGPNADRVRVDYVGLDAHIGHGWASPEELTVAHGEVP